jgi:hypothetical protein
MGSNLLMSDDLGAGRSKKRAKDCSEAPALGRHGALAGLSWRLSDPARHQRDRTFRIERTRNDLRTGGTPGRRSCKILFPEPFRSLPQRFSFTP